MRFSNSTDHIKFLCSCSKYHDLSSRFILEIYHVKEKVNLMILRYQISCLTLWCDYFLIHAWIYNKDTCIYKNSIKTSLIFLQEFLKKEFSQENIIFWRAVEQYKKIVESDKRKSRAKEIFTKHVSVKATDPINIEQNARQQVEKLLDSPSISTFDRPQQEVR